ncbi:MAG: hypothetical protein V1797_13725 [Pseudomonadota bacterium]
MSATNTYPHGLTRVIFESLVALTPDMAAEGEAWSPEFLQRVEQDVHRSLAPVDSPRDRLIFDMVFRRAFAEASELLLGGEVRQPSRRRRLEVAPAALPAMA